MKYFWTILGGIITWEIVRWWGNRGITVFLREYWRKGY